jgi:N6-adenosine-specific RNA methylase IME4
MPKTLTVDKEFKNLIPPLSPEEREGLEKSIINEGCRDPLVVWGYTIVDGHNRWEICNKHGIQCSMIQKEFADRNEAMIWIIRNQFGRRNLLPFHRAELALKLEPLISAKAKENQANSEPGIYGGKPLPNNFGEAVDLKEKEEKQKVWDDVGLSYDAKVNTIHSIEILYAKERKKLIRKNERERESGFKIGEIAGVSEETIRKSKIIMEKAPEEEKIKLRNGKITIHEAYNNIKKEEKKAQIMEQKKAIDEGKIELPEGVFEVLVVDPPWYYDREYDPKSGRVATPYPDMKLDEIRAIKLPAADDSIIFLWTTHSYLFEAKELLKEWGFEYKATIVWDKEHMGMGQWVRMQCEFCLLGVKGKPLWNNTSWRDIIREPRREHSRKPEIFYKMVEEITAGRKLDYFSREKREGWFSYGNDTNKF